MYFFKHFFFITFIVLLRQQHIFAQVKRTDFLHAELDRKNAWITDGEVRDSIRRTDPGTGTRTDLNRHEKNSETITLFETHIYQDQIQEPESLK